MAKREKNLEILVAELVKTNPSKELIKDLTTKLNIPYSDDIVLQMDHVLRASASLLSEIAKNKNNQGEQNV